MMSINWKSFVLNYLPTFLRQTYLFNFLYTLCSPIVLLYNTLYNYDTDVKYKLAHTSQVWSVKAVLNDTFDVDQRRITVSDSGQASIIILKPDTYNEPVVLQPDTVKPAVVISNDSAYAGSEFDFIVTVPFSITESDMYRLKALVNFYKLAGKRYKVIA